MDINLKKDRASLLGSSFGTGFGRADSDVWGIKFFSCGWGALVGLVVGINLIPSALPAGLQSLVVGINLMRAPSLPPSSLPFLHLVVDINLIVVPLPARWPARSEVPSNPPCLASLAFSVLLGVFGLGLEHFLLAAQPHAYVGMHLPLWLLGLRTMSTESLFFSGRFARGGGFLPHTHPPTSTASRLR